MPEAFDTNTKGFGLHRCATHLRHIAHPQTILDEWLVVLEEPRIEDADSDSDADLRSLPLASKQRPMSSSTVPGKRALVRTCHDAESQYNR